MGSAAVLTDEENTIGSDTEVESDEIESDDLESDIFLGFSANTIRILEACLLSSFAHDLDLAARLIPRIYGLLRLGQSRNAPVPISSGTSDAENHPDASESSNTSSASATTSNGDVPQKPQVQKRGRDADEDEERDGRGNRRLKRTGSRSGARIDNDPPPTFACHFRKKDPMKYNPFTDRKYHNCISPRIPHHRLRAIKWVCPNCTMSLL